MVSFPQKAETQSAIPSYAGTSERKRIIQRADARWLGPLPSLRSPGMTRFVVQAPGRQLLMLTFCNSHRRSMNFSKVFVLSGNLQ